MQAIQAMQAMMRDMMQQQNDLQEQMRELRQQPQPGQLSYRQQLQLQQERESRELQICHEQQLHWQPSEPPPPYRRAWLPVMHMFPPPYSPIHVPHLKIHLDAISTCWGIESVVNLHATYHVNEHIIQKFTFMLRIQLGSALCEYIFRELRKGRKSCCIY